MTMPFRSVALAATFLLAAWVAPSLTYANGRLPAANQIVFAQDDADHVLLRTTFGLLSSTDGGQNWDWICESSLQYSGIQDPTFGLLANGNVLASAFEGLSVSRDRLCNFRLEPGALAGRAFADLTVRSGKPREAWVLASESARTADAGAFDSHLFVTEDAAERFRAVGAALDPSILFETVELSASDPARVYLSGVRGSGPSAQAVVLVSRDTGRTFLEKLIPLMRGERAPYVSGVDPLDPNRLYVRTAGDPSVPGRLLLSEDAGENFREIFRTDGPMLGFALDARGDTIFAGSTASGLSRASARTLQFEKQSDIQVQCLSARQGASGRDELWACSNQVSGFIAGRSTDGGRSFEPRLRLSGVRGPLACSDGATTARCATEWPKLKRELGISEAPAPADASALAPTGPKQATNAGELGGGACATSPNAAGGLMLAITAVLVRMRRASSGRRRGLGPP
jgi:hypothetical protein